MLAVRAVFILVVLVALALFLASFLKSVMGKPLGKTLSVPRGKTSMKVDVCDDGPMRPFRYGQVFDVLLTPAEKAPAGAQGQEPQVGTDVTYKGVKVGFVDASSSYGQALMALAAGYPKVLAQAAVMGTEADGRADLELMLPNAKWFAKALKESAKQE